MMNLVIYSQADSKEPGRVAEQLEVDEPLEVAAEETTLGSVGVATKTDEVIEADEVVDATGKVESMKTEETQVVIEGVECCRCVTPALEWEGPDVVTVYTSPFPSVVNKQCLCPQVDLVELLSLIVAISILIGVIGRC